MSKYFTNQTISILENILHGVIVTDTRGHILFWNSANEKIFGYSKQEISNRPINVLFDDESELPLRELLHKCSLSEPVLGRWHGVHKSGSRIWLEIRAKLIKNANGAPLHCIITLADIDKLKEAESHLNQSRAIAEAILTASSDAIITANSKGMILSVNKSVLKMFRYEQDELIGENLKILMPFPYNINHDKYMDNSLVTGKKNIIDKGRETQGLRKDGSVFPIELTISEIMCEGNRMFTGIIRDLSTRRELERQLIEIGNEERRRIGRDLHDGLGQMLTGIRMLSESLARKLNANALPGADEVEEIAGMIKEADEMARSIARNMVQVEIEKKGLVVAIKDLCLKTQKMTGISCKLTADDEVEIENHTMALHMYRIVQEAVNNAVKHGMAEHIEIRLSKNNHHLALLIDDDGVGFCDDTENHDGKGIQIMKHRAGIMGGILEISRTADDLTRLRCLVPNNFEYFT